MEVNDKYILEITSSAKGINKVAGDLDRLKQSLKGFTFSASKEKNFQTFANSINAFGKATSSIDTGKIVAFSSAMKQLGDVKIKLPQGLDKTVKEIEKAFTGLGDTKELYKKVNSFSRIMQPLSDLKFGGIRGAGDAVKNLEKSLGSLDFRKIHGEADALNRTLKPLADTMEKIGSVKLGSMFGRSIGSASKAMQDALDGNVGVRRKSGSKEGVKDGDSFRQSASDFAKGLDRWFDSTPVGKFYSAIEKVKEKISIIKEELAKTNIGKFFKSMADGAKRALSAMKSLAKVAGNTIKVISNIGFLNPFKNVANSIQNTLKKFKNLSSSLARIAMYRALRSAIKEIAQAVREGLTNLYQWSKATGGDFAPAVDKLATSMLYLKNSIGASVSPLITYFTPAIELAIDKIVQFINVINQLFARLTGRSTWTEALRYPTEFAESASGATKKVKDNIQSFDELHILRTDKGGGGGSSMDYNNMFQESEFTQGLTEWIENFKREIQHGRWYEAGNILAEQVNGVIDRVNWGRFGDRLADKINTAFSFAWGFLHNVDFVNIGSSIATFLNHAIDSVDANLVGQVFARKWTMIIDTLYGFVTTFDFTNFGRRVSEFVEGWFEEIDGARIGQTISFAIRGILDSAIEFLSNDTMINNIAEDIADIINNIDWYGIFCRVLTIGTQIMNAISTVIETAISGGSRNVSQNTGLNVERLYASAPASIAQRVQNEYASSVSRGHTGSIGEQIVQSFTNSVNTADTSSFENALIRLFRNVWNAIKVTIGRIFEEGSTELIARIVENITGIYIDRNGNAINRNPIDTSSQSATLRDISSRTYTGGHDVESYSSELVERSLGLRQGYYDEENIEGINRIGKNFSIATREANRFVKSVGNVNRSMNTLNANSNSVGRTLIAVNANVKTFSIESVSGVKGVETAFTSFGNKLSGDVVGRVNSAKSTIVSSFNSMKDEASVSLATLGANVFSSMEQTANSVVTPLLGIKNNIVTTFRDAGEESARSISNLKDRMSTSLNGLVESSRGQLEGYKETWNQLHGATRGVSNSVIDGSERMANAVTDAFNSLVDNLKGFKIDIPNYKFESPNIRKINRISIPRLATGGIATSATTAMIGEAGREAILPLENNTEWMDILANRINGGSYDEVALLREQNELLRQIASKNVTISSREVFNAVREENSDYIVRTGQNALAF